MSFTLGRRAVLAVYALLVVVPVAVVVLGSLKTTQELFDAPFGLPTSPSLSAYDEVLTGQSLDVAFRNSAVVTAASVLVTLVLASLAAYGCSRIPGKLGWVIFGALVLGMSVPAQTNVIPQYVLFDYLGLLDSLVGLALINVVSGLPVAIFILGGFMRTLPPSLFEASSIDGSGPWRTFRSIALPLSAPAVATTAIFLLVIQWNELLYPLFFVQSPEKRTLPLALLNFQGQYNTDYPLLFTGVILSAAPIVIAYVFLQRYFVAGMTAGSAKG